MRWLVVLDPIDLDGPKRRPESWETQLEASLAWFVDQEVLSLEDAATVRDLRLHALELMADTVSWLLGEGKAVKLDILQAASDVMVRLDRFWGRITVDCDPAYDGRDVADGDIIGKSSALVGLLLGAVSEP